MLTRKKIRRKVFDQVKADILEDNRSRLVKLSGLMSAAMLCMIAGSWYFDSLEKNRMIYAAIAVVSLIITLIAASSRNKFVINSALYAFAAEILMFGILLGTFIEPGQTSVSFPVMLFAVPLLFTDLPVRMNSVIISSIAVYCLAAVMTQGADMLQYNLTNIIPYGLFSVFISTFMMNIKIRSFELQMINDQIIDDQNSVIRELRSVGREPELMEYKTAYSFQSKDNSDIKRATA